jgi:hypothetical protein
MRVKGLLLLGVIVGVLIIGDLILPDLVSSYAMQSLKELTNSQSVTVQAKKTPAIMMITGKFDQVTVDAVNAKVDRMTLSSMHAELNNAQVDMKALLTERRFAVQSVDNLTMTGTVSQAELAHFLDANVKGSHNAEVAITPDKMTVSTHLAVGSLIQVVITLEGKVVSDGQTLKFVTQRFLLNNTPVGNIGGTMLTEIPLLDLKKLPFGTTIQDIQLQNEQILIVAGKHS